MTSFCTCEDISITKTITWGSNFTSSYCGLNLVYKEEKRKQKNVNHIHYLLQTLAPSVIESAGSLPATIIFHPVCAQHITWIIKCFTKRLGEPGIWMPDCENCVCCFCIKCWLVFHQIPESDGKGKCQFFLETLRQTRGFTSLCVLGRCKHW